MHSKVFFSSKQKHRSQEELSCRFIPEPERATKALTHLDGPAQRAELNWRGDVQLRGEAANCCLTDESASRAHRRAITAQPFFSLR